jgi:hypothetical protein
MRGYGLWRTFGSVSRDGRLELGLYKLTQSRYSELFPIYNLFAFFRSHLIPNHVSVCVRIPTLRHSCAAALRCPSSMDPLSSCTFSSRSSCAQLLLVCFQTGASYEYLVCVPKENIVSYMRLLPSFRFESASQWTHEVPHQNLWLHHANLHWCRIVVYNPAHTSFFSFTSHVFENEKHQNHTVLFMSALFRKQQQRTPCVAIPLFLDDYEV